MQYNWQQPDWPHFSYELDALQPELLAFVTSFGKVDGIRLGLLPSQQWDAVIDQMISEAMRTSAIEGEFLNRNDVYSSICNNLGIYQKSLAVKDKRAKGIVEMIVAARKTFSEPLAEEMLFSWHRMLLQHEIARIQTGRWRSGSKPMQVISGSAGKVKVHFEAPPSEQVQHEMNQFISWFNQTAPNGSAPMDHAPIRAAIAHLYFESIHPFEDGNGRIGRVIAEKALAQSLGKPVLLSLSSVIEPQKKKYYAAIMQAQNTNHITQWLKYFVSVINDAQTKALHTLEFTIKKARFLQIHKSNLSERQLEVINKMLDAGINGFAGGITATKYMSICRTSKATATRDLQALAGMNALVVLGGGRSTSYQLNLDLPEYSV
jgi:Fic family protein